MVCRRSLGWRKGQNDAERNRSLGDVRATVAGNTIGLGANGDSDGAPSTSTRRGGWATSRRRIRLD